MCRRLVHSLEKRGVICTVVAAKTLSELENVHVDGVIPVVRIPTLGRLGGRWMNALIFQVLLFFFLYKKRKEIDLIHVHTAEWIAGVAALGGALAGVAVLCKPATLPVLTYKEWSVPFEKFWARMRMRCHFAVLNDAMKDELLLGGIPASNIVEIPNAVPLPDLLLRCEDASTVLYVGNLTQGHFKGFDSLFAAWSLLCKERQDVKLVFYGGGDPSPWEQYLEEQNCRETVAFMGFSNNLAEGFKRAAVFVLPSNQEGMSNALLEAQSWGIPGVVSDIAGNRSVIDDGVNGLIVAQGDPVALAEGVRKLLDDPEMRLKMGAAARRRAEERFAIDKVTDKVIDCYAKLVQKK
jgi:glycosyltransferase involved in cell wall biosynthesis